MKLLRIKDNSQTKRECFSEVKNITGKIADKTLEQLEKDGIFVFPEMIRDADDITKEQIILQSVNDYCQTGNVMGFLGCGDERLIIESRFCTGGNDFFLQYLLTKAPGFPNIINLKTDTDPDDKLFNMLLFLFPYYLKQAMRKGIFKTYIRSNYNDDNIRGAIDIARHIKQNVPFIGNIAYSRHEYSYDNVLTELIRHTVEFIKHKIYGGALLLGIKDEVTLIVNATPGYKFHDRQKVILQNQQNIVRHAYYREYRALQQLCLLILLHQKHLIGSGVHRIYGILFDGAWLWEQYISTLIGDTFYHPMNKKGEGKQWLFTKDKQPAEKNANRIGAIFPDFIGKDGRNRIIADAKYKTIDNIGNKDYLQLLAYMFRFGAKAGFYLYPEIGNADNMKLWLNKGSSYEKNVSARDDISVIKYGLKIPVGADCYDKFDEMMKKSEKDFTAVFNSNAYTPV